MSSEAVFFILRVLAGLALAGFLLALYILIWRSLKQMQTQMQARHTPGGHLTLMSEVEGQLAPSDKRFVLLPLTTLGRSANSAIVVDNSFASGRHARIVWQDGHWWLEDCGSRNGTQLNAETIHERTILADGDVIGIGSRHYKLELVRQQAST